MAKFKDFSKYSLPIVMSDRSRIKQLQEILTSFDETGLAYSELEDYIGSLTLIGKDFFSNISNNLKLKGMKEGIAETAEKMLNGIVILSPPSSEYNCHGWSLGTVRNIPLSSSNTKNLLAEIDLYRMLADYKSHIDNTMKTLYAIPKSVLKQNSNLSREEGSIITYCNKDNAVTHTAKYVKNVQWYTYEDELYKDWYDKDKKVVKFTSKTDCVVESYTSKLGLGHLVAHDPRDLVPLYGDINGLFDIALE